MFRIVRQPSPNPFLRPGSKKPVAPSVVRQAPPPPAPIPRNPNLEFRGYFKYENEWNFAIFDKSKNQGIWLKKGESFDEGKIEIIDFDLQLHEVRLKGGMKLVLKDSDKTVLAVPSGQSCAQQKPKLCHYASAKCKNNSTTSPSLSLCANKLHSVLMSAAGKSKNSQEDQSFPRLGFGVTLVPNWRIKCSGGLICLMSID